MLALDLALLTGIFVVIGLLSQESYVRMFMRYAGVLGIIVTLFQLQVSYGFSAQLGDLYLMFVAWFLLMLILDIVMLVPIALQMGRKRGWIR